MLKKLAIIWGVLFLAAGILGFVPAAVTDHKLLGLFHVDTMHNIIHILSGLIAFAASGAEKTSRLYFVGFGWVYALVAVVGFIQGDTVLGLFHVNSADNWLHVFFAVLLLGIGYGVPHELVERDAA